MKTPTPDQKIKIRRMMDNLRREKRKPDLRTFPKYFPGMTAADYIRRYNALNGNSYVPRVTLEFITDSIITESRTYDPLTPLCLEEVTHD